MLAADIHEPPALQMPAELVAQAPHAAQASMPVRTLGVCFSTTNEFQAENVRDPERDAQLYLRIYDRKTADSSAMISVVQTPRHGVFRKLTSSEAEEIGESFATGLFAFIPDKGYVGSDRVAVDVGFNGVTIRIQYFIHVRSGLNRRGEPRDSCRQTGEYWKISELTSGGHR